MKKFLGVALASALVLPFAGATHADAATKPEVHQYVQKYQVNSPQELQTIIKQLESKYHIDLSNIYQPCPWGHVQYKEKTYKAPDSGTHLTAAHRAKTPEHTQQAKQPQAQKQQQTQTQTQKQQSQEPSKSGSKATAGLSQFEQKVVDLTNAERAKQGLSPLKVDPALSKMARDKSQDMMSNNYFDHNSPTYGSPFDMMKSYGISYTAAGENIAAGQKTPQDVVDAWMKSPGHRANILNKSYTYIGVGYVKGGSYGSYWTQEFIRK